MGKLTPESHGIESPAPPAPYLCGSCRAPGDLLAPPLVLALFHGLAMAFHTPGPCGVGDPLVDPTLAWPLYLWAVALGLGHLLFYPARNPEPGKCAGLFGFLALTSGALGFWFAPEPGACLPEPGVPWISYPALFLAFALLGLATNLLAGSLARRAQPEGAARVVLRTAVAPLLLVLLVVVACWIDGHRILWDGARSMGLFGLVAATMLAASPSGRSSAAP